MPPSDHAFAPLPAQVGDLVSDPSGKVNQPAVEVLELATEGVHVVDVRLDRAFEIRLFLEGFRVRLAVFRGCVDESFPVVRFRVLDQFAQFPEAGELLSYGPLPQERFQRMAVYVDRILRGARPGELPIEQPTTFELVVNLKTAETLGLTIPQSLLLRAAEVIR